MGLLINKYCLSLLSGLALSGAASATLIDHGSFLTDTQSGLDWLDVTASINRSYNDVSSQFGPGGNFPGWRYATGMELNSLISHYTGITQTTYGYILQEPDRIDGLIAMLGSTLDVGLVNLGHPTYDAGLGLPEGAGLDYTAGILGDWDRGIYVWYALLFDYDVSSSQPDSSSTHSSSPTPDYKWWDIGSFLVRDTPAAIPEPPIIVLLATGIIGIAINRRKLHVR